MDSLNILLPQSVFDNGETFDSSCPRFTIVMANYNNGRWVGEAIESILNQTFRYLELIVVDDCSTDNSIEVIQTYLKDKRVKLIKHEQNRGFTGSLITGISNVRSEIFGLLDSDDVILPQAVEIMYNEHIKHPECGLIYSGLVDCDENLENKTAGYSRQIPQGLTNLEADVVSGFKSFKLKYYKQTEGYDESYLYGEDKDVIYKMEEVSKLKFIPEYLYLYRHLSDSQSHDPEKKIIGCNSMDRSRIAAYRRRLKMPAFNKQYSLSVVIPAYNRPELLLQVLNGFANQTVSKDDYEVIVIDDGSEPTLKLVVKQFNQKMNVVYLRQPNSGPGVARNLGVELARGEIILFNDNDDLPAPDLIAENLRSHREYPEENVAVLGHLDWHESLSVNAVMHYITGPGGEYLGFARMQDGKFYDSWKWWAGLISAKRSFLASIEGPYDESLHFGYEDTELACRLFSRNVKILYNANAKRYIIRSIDFNEFASRRYNHGKALYFVAQKHPDVIMPRYGLENAEQVFDEKLSQLNEWKAQVPLVESQLANSSNLSQQEQASLLQTLYDLYRVCFMGEWLKGYIDQKHEVEQGRASLEDSVNAPSVKPTQTIAECKVDYNTPIVTNGARAKKITLINSFLPVYDLGSSNLRIYELLKIIESQGHLVDYVYFSTTPKDELIKAKFGTGINFIKIEPTGDAILKYFRGKKQNEIDYVWITNLWLVDYLVVSKQLTEWLEQNFPSAKVIVDTMDFHYKKYIRKYEVSREHDDLDRAKQFLEIEKKLYPIADSVIVVTEKERQDILDGISAPVNVGVVPNIHQVASDIKPLEDRKHICFLGSFNINHNKDAVLWFLEDVWPLIVQKRPDIEFHLLGFGNELYQSELQKNQNVKVVGYVEDADEAVAGYKLFVCPMLYGAGMKGKLGTSAANGTPIVTTSIGAEGFNFIDGENCFISDAAEEFADKCVKLIDDQSLWHKFSKSAYQLVADNFGIRTVSEIVSKVFDCESTVKNIRQATRCKREKKTNSKHCEVITNNKPKVTVITSCYNCKDYIHECVESIRNQTLTDWELFLLDDASTDGSDEIIKEYAEIDSRIRAYCFEDNRGPYVRRNFAIQNAQAEYTVVHDVDDIMATDKLEKLYNCISSDDNLAVVGSLDKLFCEELCSDELCDKIILPREHDNISYRFYTWQHAMSISSSITRKKMFDTIGMYDKNRIAADRFWFAKLGLYAQHNPSLKFKNIPEYLTYRRIHGLSQTQINSIYDPRSRRQRYKDYCKYVLGQIEKRVNSEPGLDIAQELCKCDCSDFMVKFSDHIERWEDQVLDDSVMVSMMGNAVLLFNAEKFVSCIDTLNNIERMFPEVVDRFANFCFLRGMSLLSIGYRQRGLQQLTLELEKHKNPAVRQFLSDYVGNRIKGSIFDWCQLNGGKYNLEFEDRSEKNAPQKACQTA